MATDDLAQHVRRLERRLRRLQLLLASAALAGGGALLAAWARPQQPTVLRVRGLVVEDARGRARVVLGAPVPDPGEGRRISPAAGLVINDTAGAERFGVGLQANGRMTLGFDAPPGTGDDRNRERITVVADERGGAYLRVLDRRTFARAFVRLGDDDQAYLDLAEPGPGRVRVRRIGARGDTVVLISRGR